ncbi:hypothetical protein [Actinophytocola sp.]|uniref:hypothetical protein n=1 Tax=Actinophytocola sp. TaxID=1872138 RepID=UPI002ED46AD8
MASWNHDGTQDPGPPPLMADPLSGLVTGGKYDGEAVRVRVVEPAAPDIEKVRTAMESVLDENSELRVDLLPGAPRKAPAPKPAPAPTEKLLTPPAGVPMPPPRQGLVPAEIPPQRAVRPPRTRWSPGLTAVGLLLLVMAVLAIVMLASLIDTIASLFN